MLSLLLWSGLVWRVGTHLKVCLSTIKMLQGWSSRPGKKKNKCCRVFYRCPEINKKKEQQGDACCNSCVVMGCEDWHNCGWKCPHGAVAWWQRLFSCTFIHPLWRLVFVGFLYKKKRDLEMWIVAFSFSTHCTFVADTSFYPTESWQKCFTLGFFNLVTP